ncbi:MAG: AAA family ATPase [Bacteroidales bacterium]|nr:AAA family ATPase [Bacteroidales bacterium]
MKNFLDIKTSTDSLFSDDEIRINVVFFNIFKTLPNTHTIYGEFNVNKCYEYVKETYNLVDNSPNILTCLKSSSKKRSKAEKYFGLKHNRGIEISVIIEDELIITIRHTYIEIFYSSNIPTEKTDSLIKSLLDFKVKKKKKTNKFHMIVSEYDGFGLSTFKLKEQDYNTELCYNDDFHEIDIKIQKFLNNKSKNGLILLHGQSGTGKTTYIRNLISKIPRKFIFLPLHMAEALSNPELIPFLTTQKNSILIIEDCEKLIVDRELGNYNNSIATLLNLSDGLLSDALGIKLICTFNTNISKIDKALVRKGRMLTRYEFKELTIAKASVLSEKFDLKYDGKNPISIGDLFNVEENNNAIIKSTKVGFK